MLQKSEQNGCPKMDDWIVGDVVTALILHAVVSFSKDSKDKYLYFMTLYKYNNE